jgi:large subunit ribosomal protein L1
MPSPKSGTVVDDVPTAVREYSAGKVEFRNDDGGNLHVAVGKLSFEADKLAENIESFIGRIKAMKPTTSKGTFIKKMTLSATMTPGVTISDQQQ